MTNVYLHDSELGIHYQEDGDTKLWVVKQKKESLVFFGGTEEEMEKYHRDNEEKILDVYAFSDMLMDYMNLVGDAKLRPVMPIGKYLSMGEQVL